MPSRRRICLVTEEEMIGDLRGSVIAALARDASLQVHLLLPAAGLGADDLRASLAGQVEVHFAPAGRTTEARDDSIYPPPGAFDCPWQAESLGLLLALKDLARKGLSFDVIEFPDRKGWAHCTLQEKLLGRDFADAEIRVRLQGTVALQRLSEGQPLTLGSLVGFELERKAMLDAERVVASDHALAVRLQTYYGLPRDWLDGVALHDFGRDLPTQGRRARPHAESPPLVTVAITNFNLSSYLAAALASVAATSHPNLEVVLVDDASTDAADRALLADLQKRRTVGAHPIKILRNETNRGLAASRNIGLQAAAGKYVLPLDADDLISPRFIELAVAALEAQPEFDVVVPTAARFESQDQVEERRFQDFLVFVGDVPTLGLVANRFSTATALMRRSLFERFRYDETLPCYEDWALYLALALDGRRFLVTNDVQFHYRRRPGSMIAGITAARHLEVLARIYESLPRPLPPAVHPFASLVPACEAYAEIARLRRDPDVLAWPLRYRLVDAITGAFSKAPLVHRALKLLGRRLAASARGGDG